jgi:DNA polymerase III subunit chi
MAAVWFYELTDEPAENVLPGLLAKHFQRQDRVSVLCQTATFAQELSQRIWAIEDVSFVAHGVEGEGRAAANVIWISSSPANANNAQYRYCVEGCMPAEFANFERISVMFESNEEQKTLARETWKSAKRENIAVKYWKKDESGRWVDQAASN